MKLILSTLLLLSSLSFFAQSNLNPLPICPKSPNCFRSELNTKKYFKRPLKFKNDLNTSNAELIALISNYENTELVNKSSDQLEFLFTTKVGKFVDEVSFQFDEDNNCIHFRSASRKGWSDMGANKRRMKKIVKDWNNLN